MTLQVDLRECSWFVPKQLFYFELIDTKMFYNRSTTPCILWLLDLESAILLYWFKVKLLFQKLLAKSSQIMKLTL